MNNWLRGTTGPLREEEELEVAGGQPAEFWHRANLYQFIYSVLGLIVGVVCVISGVVLFLHGVTGHTSWTTRILGASSQLSDAGPGVIFAVLGLFVIWSTRYNVKLSKHDRGA
jgi:hypothetical protein